ncbi:MAG: septum formation initiator family protein [Candidatus Gottesmanbacteria bacterium]
MFKKKIINLLIIIIGLFLIINLTRSIREILQAGDRIKNTENQVNELQNKNKDLKKKLAEVESPAYLEKTAREKLGLAREGEIVVIMPSPNTVIDLSGAHDANLSNWEKWRNLFF